MAAAMTPDERRVQAIERRHELRLLDRLLNEAARPVPAPPVVRYIDPTLRRLLLDLMLLIAATYPAETRGGDMRRPHLRRIA
jgi:hypothetical protein